MLILDIVSDMIRSPSQIKFGAVRGLRLAIVFASPCLLLFGIPFAIALDFRLLAASVGGFSVAAVLSLLLSIESQLSEIRQLLSQRSDS